ncbi:leucyl/phenylalanyl-tRNA--protein transferase [Deltaproteobacteria bacterium TL4]
MPVYFLSDQYIFPPQEKAEPDGLLAVGGDLSKNRLLEAYRNGIFPWYEEGQPLLWWSPNPRLILEPDELKVSRSLQKTIKKAIFDVRMDTAFASVISACAEVRIQKNQRTWITSAMEKAYTVLHEEGFAHSVEAWFGDELVGGLYGICLGKCFFGESMFSVKSDASKVALVALVEYMKQWGGHMIDCQVTTRHLLSMGAKEISRKEFLKRLKQEIAYPTIQRKWTPS